MNLKNINTNTLSITDYELVASKVARVVIAFTGSHTRESFAETLGEKLRHMATPIENSFRMVKAGVMVGYVRANTAVRVVEDEKELRASYQVMASNILMDNNDKTLWELKQGASGRYLARHGNEDLSELVEAAVNPIVNVPRVHQLAIASVAKREFVAFASESGDMDYGFCVGVDDEGQRLRVVSSMKGRAITIPTSAVASVNVVKLPKQAHKRITEAGISREDAKQESEYYTRLFSYDPAYMAEIIRQVEGTATM